MTHELGGNVRCPIRFRFHLLTSGLIHGKLYNVRLSEIRDGYCNVSRFWIYSYFD
jgi:hypothetical protein